jgi:hypothetical protein
MAMPYESRVATIARALNTFLRQFKMPDHFDQETALQRIRMTADAINKRLPASLHPGDLEARLSEAFVSVLEKHKGREWPNVEQFVSAVETRPQHTAEPEAEGRGDRSRLSADQAKTLDKKIIPTARKWLGTSLDGHARKTLEFWGEKV